MQLQRLVHRQTEINNKIAKLRANQNAPGAQEQPQPNNNSGAGSGDGSGEEGEAEMEEDKEEQPGSRPNIIYN